MSSRSDFLEAFTEVVCPFAVLVRMGLVLAIMFLLLLAVSFFYVESGSANYVMAVLSTGVVGVTALGMAGLLWLCNRPWVND